MTMSRLVADATCIVFPAALCPSRTISIGARYGGLEQAPIGSLRPHDRNARRHSKKQIAAIARSMERFGFTNPILITADARIIAGHGRWEAARHLGISHVPVIRIEGMTEADIRAYIIADNKLAERAGWDKGMLVEELSYLIDLGYNIELTGFEIAEVDLLQTYDAGREADPGRTELIPELRRTAVTRSGDLWRLGKAAGRHHRLVCGDAQDPATIATVMTTDQATMVLTDPPYNVPINGHVSGRGKRRHAEFAMASGEQSEAEFIAFLTKFLSGALGTLAPGALLFVCMDYRHMFELQSAARSLGLSLLNLCVWNKSNGGMGTLYRSKHELVLIFKADDAPHINNVELGKHGRSRTNVWDYAGQNAFRKGRAAELDMHPTVKPVAMLADAIRDVTKTGHVVLDPFGGSGSTLIAAEETGRQARLVEIDPLYCDVTIRRWEAFTGRSAVLTQTGETFEEVEARRGADAAAARARPEGDATLDMEF